MTLTVPAFHKTGHLQPGAGRDRGHENEDQRDELKRSWLCVPVFGRVARERMENDEVRVTIFAIRCTASPVHYLSD